MRIKRALRVVLVLAGMAVGCAIDNGEASDPPQLEMHGVSGIDAILTSP